MKMPERSIIIRRVFDLVLIGALIYAGLLATGVVRRGGRFEQGSPAPELVLRKLPDGANLSLADFRGKPLVLTFFSTSCPSCRRELPDLAEMKAELGDKVNFLVVTNDAPNVVMEYLKKEGLDLALAWDSGTTHQRYQVDTIPYNVVISADGIIKQDVIGGLKLSDLN